MNRSRREDLELRLAQGGAAALEHDAELREWVESDDNALALFEAMIVLDQSFESLASGTAPDTSDAPDELVAALLARPELAQPASARRTRPSWPSWRRPHLGWQFQVGVAMAAMLVVVSSFVFTELEPSAAPDEARVASQPRFQRPESEELSAPDAASDSTAGSAANSAAEAKAEKEISPEPEERLRSLGYVAGDEVDRISVSGGKDDEADSDGPGASGADDKVWNIDGVLVTDMGAVGTSETYYSFDAFQETQAATGFSDSTLATGGVTLSKVTKRGGNDWKGSGRFIVADDAWSSNLSSSPSSGLEPADRDKAGRFLAESRRTEGLTFQDATGYWRNPWLPGDPELRFLAARMDELAPNLPAGLHDLARRPSLPFDPPAEDALALYLHGDRTVADGPTRVVLRIGLRAADAWAGRRTSMNLAVVLHLPPATEEIPAETAASLRALLEALAESHDLGDRFQLLVAGRPGGVLVPADEFRRGAVLMAARTFFEPPTDNRDANSQPYDLASVLGAAGAQVRPGSDEDRDENQEDNQGENSPVGSSAILVVTTGSGAEELAGATALAHGLAVGGVRVSAFGVGPDASAGDVSALLARLAAAGQGSRRLVARPADAAPAIEEELAQAARAVARAVRLRIRPAPGVRLVGVFDSEPLTAPAADRVREAEQALDRRLAHKLGIESDRGDDEEGIQIVVPALYAGDAMILLVDLVAPGPGPLADVTVRYKDLVRMDNGVARARFDLAYGEAPEVPAGPLEVSVVKSLLAQDVKACLEQAADDLEGTTGDAIGDALRDALRNATATLGACRDLLRGMATRVPSLAGDPDLARDLRMLDGYLQALAADPGADTISAVRQSLHYAGKLKTLPPPEPAHD